MRLVKPVGLGHAGPHGLHQGAGLSPKDTGESWQVLSIMEGGG